MNERIRELAEQAKLLTGWPNGLTDYQKFAELIVKECARKITEDVIVFTKNDNETKELCVEAILEHFGVK